MTNKSIPHFEKPLHERFQEIYQELAQLKNNRNKYISSKQVSSIYDRFLSFSHELTLTRKDEELKGITLVIPNGNDLLIDDIWQLLSLCFVTCGLTKFAPATYSSLSTVNKLLSHLKECQVYTIDDLSPIKARLNDIKEIINNSENQSLEEQQEEEDYLAANHAKLYDQHHHSTVSHKREETLLLRNKLNKCQQVYNELEESFKKIPPDLQPYFSDLIKIRKTLLNYLTNGVDTANEGGFDAVSDRSSTPVPESTESAITNVNTHFHYNTHPSSKHELPTSGSSTPKPPLSKVSSADGTQVSNKLNELRKRLKQIQSVRDEEGKFASDCATEEQLVSSQMILNGLLDDCNNLINDVSIQQESSDISTLFESLAVTSSEQDRQSIDKFKHLYNQLIEIKLTLENLLITRRWTMRETDLYNYQKLLKVIDDERITLNASISTEVPTSSSQQQQSSTSVSLKNVKRLQILILYLLRRCYSLIYKLLESSEPVSESLQPIHNQLSTVRRCLLEIKRIDGLNNLRELYPFQFKLASLDNLRSDGKFIINNQIPEGQGTLNALLAECFDIIHELKIELEEKEEQDYDDEEDDDGHDDGTKQAIVVGTEAEPQDSHPYRKLKNKKTGDRKGGDITDDEDIKSDDEVELKRNRYVGFNEADYDQESESDYDAESNSSISEYEDNDYY